MFGDMPLDEDIAQNNVTMINVNFREIQRANDIN